MLRTMFLFSKPFVSTHRRPSPGAILLLLFSLAALLFAPGRVAALEVVQIGPPLERELPTPRLSADGGIVVGSNGLERSLIDGQAAMWSREAGLKNLGTLPGHNVSLAEDVSADGSVVVGRSHILDGGGITSSETFLWTEANGMTGLGFYGFNLLISGDGSTIAGTLGTVAGSQAFLWREGQGTPRWRIDT